MDEEQQEDQHVEEPKQSIEKETEQSVEEMQKELESLRTALAIQVHQQAEEIMPEDQTGLKRKRKTGGRPLAHSRRTTSQKSKGTINTDASCVLLLCSLPISIQ